MSFFSVWLKPESVVIKWYMSLHTYLLTNTQLNTEKNSFNTQTLDNTHNNVQMVSNTERV